VIELHEDAVDEVVEASPAVSVIMPTYNRASYVGEAVEHLLGLDGPAGGFEIVVVDDGSRDNTPEILAAYAKIPNVRVLRRVNGGPAAARNTGISASRGAVLAFTDDDCRPVQEWLTYLLAALESTKAAGVGGRTIPASASSLVSRFVARRHLSELPNAVDGEVRWLVTCNAAFRREALVDVGGFDESYPVPGGEDTDLCTRLRGAGYRLGVAPDALVRHDHTWRSVRQFADTWYRYGRGDARHLRRDAQPLQPVRRVAADLRYLPTVARNLRADFSDGVAAREAMAFAGLDILRRTSKTVGLVRAYARPSG
jgi:glycosyltransferase involved in cell wall biosynthesis